MKKKGDNLAVRYICFAERNFTFMYLQKECFQFDSTKHNRFFSKHLSPQGNRRANAHAYLIFKEKWENSLEQIELSVQIKFN